VSDDQIAAHRLTQARIDAALAVVAELREEADDLDSHAAGVSAEDAAIASGLRQAAGRVERALRSNS